MVRKFIKTESIVQTQAAFIIQFPNRETPPTAPTIKKALEDFEINGCVTKEHRKIEYPSRQLSNDKKVQICCCVENQKRQSLDKVSQQVGVSVSSVYRTLKAENYKPYKLRPVQELKNDDPFRRLTFCEQVIELIRLGILRTRNLCVTDECTIYLKIRPNQQNCREWSRENHHPILDCNTQYQQKVNVWAGLYKGQVVGPFFIPGNLNGQGFSELLHQSIIPALIAIGVDVSKFFLETF